MLRGRVGVLAGGGGGITARSYVQDGLVAMWDGIENAGWGRHEESPSSWTNLADGTAHAIEGAWEGNSFSPSTTFADDVFVEFTSTASARTIEFCTPSANILSGLNGLYTTASDRLYLQGRKTSTTLTCLASNVQVYRNTYNGEDLATLVLATDGENGSVFANGNSLTTFAVASVLGDYLFRWFDASRISALRLYNRALTADEVAYNYGIDKERFSI